MKMPIAISLLILAVGTMISWNDGSRLAEVKARHDKLAEEARQQGIFPDKIHETAGGPPPKRDRESQGRKKEDEARATAKEAIAFAKEMAAIRKSGEAPDSDMQKRMRDFMQRMISLDASQIKTLVAEVSASDELEEEARQGLLRFAIMTLSEEHPQAALAIFTESSELLGKQSRRVVSSALASWAKTDPSAAVDWFRKNGEKFPDIATDDTKLGIIGGAAASDPKEAFSLIAELGMKDPRIAIDTIASTQQTPEARTATLAALRAYLANLPDEKARKDAGASPFSSLASGMAREGISQATQWVDKANLTEDELVAFSKGLGHDVKKSETGQWVEWLGSKLPADKGDRQIRWMIGNWTQNDYLAAGTWLASTPEGPAKVSSTRAYAEAVAKYEPETAEQWAMTLPAGDSRQETLKNIYSNWPKKDEADKAAAEDFAGKHGIKK